MIYSFIIFFISILSIQSKSLNEFQIQSSDILYNKCDSAYFYEPLTMDTSFIWQNGKYNIKIEKIPLTNSCIKTTTGTWMDNIVKLSIYKNDKEIIKRNIIKEDFPIVIPVDFYETSILSSFKYQAITESKFSFRSWIGTPDTDIGYLYEYSISPEGNVCYEEIEIDDDL